MILGMTEEIVVIDAETASPVDLKKANQYLYWEHPDTQVLMLGMKKLGSEREPLVLDFASPENPDPVPARLHHLAALPPEKCMFAAANCEFDRAALRRIGIDTPIEKWLDIHTCAYILGFSGRLDDVLTQSPLGVNKDKGGKHCIQVFSGLKKKPKDEPVLYQEFLRYCAKDVEVEEALLAWCLELLDKPKMRPVVQSIFRQELIYRRINQRGLPIDTAAVKGALKIVEVATAMVIEEMSQITGLDNPNSRAQLFKWLTDRGAPLEDMKAESVRDALADGDNLKPEVRTVLDLHQQKSKTSVKKFVSLDQATSKHDHRMRGGWQFYGASRTGRVAGRKLNPANLPRPTIWQPEAVAEFLEIGDVPLLQALTPGPVLNSLSSMIRACLKAPEGKRWCVADLTSIESVGLAWLSGCNTVLDIFFEGRDTYKSFAVEAFGVPYDEVTKEMRTFSKPPVLGAGYGLSGFKLVDYAAGMGVTLEEEEAYRLIRLFRDLYHEIPHYWRQLQSAAIAAVENPGQWFYALPAKDVIGQDLSRSGKPFNHYAYGNSPRIGYVCVRDFLYCQLPSKRFLCYYKPLVEEKEVKPRRGEPFRTRNLTYMGTDQAANRWNRISTHGGKLTENVVQAVCRDVLWNGLEQAENDPGLEVVGDVYDEILCLCSEDDPGALDRLLGYMQTRPSWADERFFLGASGYISRRYKKD